jgi:nicotinate-nucleotide adenylyltransferase
LRLGILGGTFDPPHLGHLLLAQSAFEQFGLAGVLLIPTAHPFYKAARTVTAAEQRYAMAKAAVGDDMRLEASRVEIDRAGPSYTIDTLSYLHEAGAGLLEPYLVVGADALVDMPKWKGAEAIAQMATVLYAARPGTADEALEAAVAALPFQPRRIEQPPLAISSTALRGRAALGLSLRYYTPDPVAAYVADEGLYLQVPAC